MKVKIESEVVQLCLTPSDPMDCSLPGSSVHGIFQVRVLEWGAIAFSKWISEEYLWRLSGLLIQEAQRIFLYVFKYEGCIYLYKMDRLYSEFER